MKPMDLQELMTRMASTADQEFPLSFSMQAMLKKKAAIKTPQTRNSCFRGEVLE